MEATMRCRTPLVLATLLISFAPARTDAQAKTNDADVREVQAYRLTMPKLKQLNQAMADLKRQAEADPVYQQLLKKKKELATLSEKEEPTAADQDRMAQLESEIEEAEQAEDEPEEQDNSLSGMAERMAADPRIAGALKRAGLAPREAATMQMAFLQVAFAVGFLESGTIKEIPKDVNPENVKFYQANKAEIATLTALGDQGED
jgi:archaellum component FlaD/FlaE